MGKIVKYCAVCEESFAEKFSFCPNCAAALTAYEMNPVMAESKGVESVKVFEPLNHVPVETPEPVTASTVELPETQPVETAFEPATPVFLQNAETFGDDEILEIEDEKVEEPVVTVPAFTAPAVAAQSFDDYQKSYPTKSPAPKQSSGFVGEKPAENKKLDDDGFYSVTLVEPKDAGTRNMLLLGATILVLGFALFSVVQSIYNADAFVGALDEDLNNIVFAPTDEPTELEPEKVVEKKEDKGGGGGGNKDPNPVSKGQLANQSEKPMMAPSVTMDRVTNPELRVQMETKGNRKAELTNEKYGDPNSSYNVSSDGSGSGGGQGTGRNGGQGSGDGPGIGPGSGGGSGGGNRGGNGGREDDPNGEPPAMKVGPTVALSITSKPRANYTDAARQAQVQGTVTLRVTFLASGQIGSISAVSGLPNGLTEQAIAAARNMRFEPAKKNGVATTVIKQVQYTFTLY